MLVTNSTFDAYHNLDYKTPMYLIHFDGEATDYVNHEPTSPDNALKQYLVKISGLAQNIKPEEGSASIGGVKVELLDYDDEITTLLATDSYYFHRKKTIIKAGYLGMAEADMLTIFTGWVTGLKLSRDGTTYIFDVTDPQKWMQRSIFRNASDSSPVTLQGNPINILLAILTSTGAGTNGDYDWYAAANGLGLDTSYINISAIEKVRDDYYPGDSHYMKFVIKDRKKAKDFIEEQICKVLNCYPVIDGQGRFTIKAYRPPIASQDVVQTFDEDVIIGMPQWDANLSALINELEIHYNYDSTDDEFDNEIYYINADSVDNRGPGKKPLVIKTEGLHTAGIGSHADRATIILERRRDKVFDRWATPPIKLSFGTWFSRWLSEAGDVVPFTHSLVPDVEAGTRGYIGERMEIVKRDINWDKGQVHIDLLNTGFAKTGIYGAISPTMTITTASDSTSFTVAATDAAKYENYTSPEVQVCDSKMRQKVANVTLLTVDSTTGAITCDDMSTTPVAGDIVCFANYDNCSTEQQLYSFIADSSNDLGAADADANLIVP